MGWGGGHGRAKDFKEVTKKQKKSPCAKANSNNWNQRI